MDDFVKFIIIVFIIVLGGTNIYCVTNACPEDMSKITIITVFAFINILNVYFVIKGISRYPKDDLWKVIGVLLLIPFFIYMYLCENKCKEMSIPTLFVTLPCVILILNIYFLWTNDRRNMERFKNRKIEFR